MFEGFGKPKSNFSKLPHQFIDALPEITSLSEMKVILYVLRHTWGRNDGQKKMTIDEIMNGRKNNKGARLDGGTGMSRNSVRKGINDAIEDGFLVVEEDNSDLARIKRFYMLRGSDLEGQKLTPNSQELTPSHQILTPRGSEVDPRTEKEPLERTSKKEPKDKNNNNSPSQTSNPSPDPDPSSKLLLLFGLVLDYLDIDYIGEKLLASFEQKYPAEWVVEAVDAIKSKNNIGNPSGYLVRTLSNFERQRQVPHRGAILESWSRLKSEAEEWDNADRPVGGMHRNSYEQIPTTGEERKHKFIPEEFADVIIG